MNIAHLRYALEVEKTRSISKAAENLYMGQPNLSRAIRELEENLGIQLFYRNSRGMKPTPHGQEFLQHAKVIVDHVDALKEKFNPESALAHRFTISVPRAGYIAEAFAQFMNELEGDEPAEVFYRETNAQNAIENLLTNGYRMAIVRYQKTFEQYFQVLFREKGLSAQRLMEFSYKVLLPAGDPLAKKDDLCVADLRGYREVVQGDPFIPALTQREALAAELGESTRQHIFVFDRAGQLDMLSRLPHTFVWASPVPASLLERYGVVQRSCRDFKRLYRDVLLVKKGTELSELEQRFLKKLQEHVATE